MAKNHLPETYTDYKEIPVLITKNDVAALLNVIPRTIARWTAEGTFPKPIRIAKNKNLYKKEEIIEWLEGRK